MCAPQLKPDMWVKVVFQQKPHFSSSDFCVQELEARLVFASNAGSYILSGRLLILPRLSNEPFVEGED